jgi:hypothetical protein
MRKLSTSFILGLGLVIMCLPPVHAQTTASTPTAANPTSANTTPNGQAPDEVTKKIADLVHAGKYAEAQQLTAGLLAAYSNDQRLIKAKALLDKSLASSKPADPTASGDPPASNGVSDQPVVNANATQLTGMDKVDSSALVVLARQAQQTDDLSQQKKLLHQFMDQSSVFMQKHPDQTLLWQLRALSAISLNDPIAGYEAGQKLLTMGAADSNDSNSLQLLGQLKNKGWLDRQEAERQAKYVWIWGTWSLHIFHTDQRGHVLNEYDRSTGIDFPSSD